MNFHYARYYSCDPGSKTLNFFFLRILKQKVWCFPLTLKQSMFHTEPSWAQFSEADSRVTATGRAVKITQSIANPSGGETIQKRHKKSLVILHIGNTSWLSCRRKICYSIKCNARFSWNKRSAWQCPVIKDKTEKHDPCHHNGRSHGLSSHWHSAAN